MNDFAEQYPPLITNEDKQLLFTRTLKHFKKTLCYNELSAQQKRQAEKVFGPMFAIFVVETNIHYMLFRADYLSLQRQVNEDRQTKQLIKKFFDS